MAISGGGGGVAVWPNTVISKVGSLGNSLCHPLTATTAAAAVLLSVLVRYMFDNFWYCFNFRRSLVGLTVHPYIVD